MSVIPPADCIVSLGAIRKGATREDATSPSRGFVHSAESYEQALFGSVRQREARQSSTSPPRSPPFKAGDALAEGRHRRHVSPPLRPSPLEAATRRAQAHSPRSEQRNACRDSVLSTLNQKLSSPRNACLSLDRPSPRTMSPRGMSPRAAWVETADTITKAIFGESAFGAKRSPSAPPALRYKELDAPHRRSCDVQACIAEPASAGQKHWSWSPRRRDELPQQRSDGVTSCFQNDPPALPNRGRLQHPNSRQTASHDVLAALPRAHAASGHAVATPRARVAKAPAPAPTPAPASAAQKKGKSFPQRSPISRSPSGGKSLEAEHAPAPQLLLARPKSAVVRQRVVAKAAAKQDAPPWGGMTQIEEELDPEADTSVSPYRDPAETIFKTVSFKLLPAAGAAPRLVGPASLAPPIATQRPKVTFLERGGRSPRSSPRGSPAATARAVAVGGEETVPASSKHLQRDCAGRIDRLRVALARSPPRVPKEATPPAACMSRQSSSQSSCYVEEKLKRNASQCSTTASLPWPDSQ